MSRCPRLATVTMAARPGRRRPPSSRWRRRSRRRLRRVPAHCGGCSPTCSAATRTTVPHSGPGRLPTARASDPATKDASARTTGRAPREATGPNAVRKGRSVANVAATRSVAADRGAVRSDRQAAATAARREARTARDRPATGTGIGTGTAIETGIGIETGIRTGPVRGHADRAVDRVPDRVKADVDRTTRPRPGRPKTAAPGGDAAAGRRISRTPPRIALPALRTKDRTRSPDPTSASRAATAPRSRAGAGAGSRPRRRRHSRNPPRPPSPRRRRPSPIPSPRRCWPPRRMRPPRSK